jgi:CHAD domain-containing protein
MRTGANPREGPLDRFAEAQLQVRLRILGAQLRRTHQHPSDAAAIHDLRVAIRRFSQGLRVFRKLLDKAHVRKMRRPLRKVMHLSGAARNCDIALEVLETAGAPAAQSLRQRVAERRSQAGRELLDFFVARNLLAKTKRWREWLRVRSEHAPTTAPATPRALVPLWRKFLQAGVAAAQPHSTPKTMHRFRLRAKRLRYTLEIFGAASGPGWKRQIERIRALQEHLGAINDCVSTRDLVAQLGGRSSPALQRLLEHRIDVFRLYWHQHFEQGTME